MQDAKRIQKKKAKGIVDKFSIVPRFLPGRKGRKDAGTTVSLA